MSMNSANEVIFNPETRVAPLGLIAMNGATELGDKINSYLVEWAKQGGENKLNIIQARAADADIPKMPATSLAPPTSSRASVSIKFETP